MENLNGMVADIIFENRENGYMVCELITEEQDDVVIVGCLPFVAPGDKLRLTGSWVMHMEYGEQFKVEHFEKVLPETAEDILIFLSSGVIHGIGAKTAQKIVNTFGADTLRIMREEPGKLASISGISMDKASKIHAEFISSEAISELIVFLGKNGVSTNMAYKIFRALGEDALERIHENPYILCNDIDGITFSTADKIAASLSFDPASRQRIEAAVLHTLSDGAGGGHTFLPQPVVEEYVAKLLHVSVDQIQTAIYQLHMTGRIRIVEQAQFHALYLTAFYTAEEHTAHFLTALRKQVFEIEKQDILNDIAAFEEKHNIQLAERQKQAVEYALTSGILVITGGPGTGKTTIIQCMIDLMERRGLDIVLAAPTGRAAKRMTQMCHREAKTIHRLLEVEFDSVQSGQVFKRDRNNPLEHDVIIIDEVSMLDITMMFYLLRAVKHGARVILVGDSDQLPSVGAGNVLEDVIESGAVPVVRLEEIFRQAKQSMIVVNAHRINRGEYPETSSKSGDFFILRRPSTAQGVAEILELCKTRLPKYLGEDPLDAIQVLTPVKKGETGVENLNKQLQQVFNPPGKDKKEVKRPRYMLRTGDKIMQIRNNYDIEWTRSIGQKGAGIFNGDIGFIEDIDKRQGVLYIVFDGDKQVTYPFELLDDIDLAYAMTVHKSQGSEFSAVVMPVYPVSSMLLSRNLFYTAVTRARRLVVLVGREEVIRYMTDNNRESMRYSGLTGMLQEKIQSEEGTSTT